MVTQILKRVNDCLRGFFRYFKTVTRVRQVFQSVRVRIKNIWYSWKL
ncbi:MAG: hypothetical protein LBR85_01825 [Oscillospiraceae bacterium]|nr:hypothetical protein [Oscillospiraceae bacterium]